MLFDLVNLPYWIFLGMGVLLFMFVIVSGGGDDDIDLDVDADLDADISADGDSSPLDFDTDTDGEFSALQVLGWLGIGKAPLLLLLATDLSLWGLLGWMLNVAVGGTVIFSGVVLLGSMVLALGLGGVVARPIGRAFASFGEDVSGDRLVGCIGTVSTGRIPPVEEGKIGQVDVLDPARNLVTVNAVLPDWATAIPQRGNNVILIDRSGSNYLVVVQNSADQDQWLSNSARFKDSH